MQVFFSIIIPVYNTERYLSRCLDSILSQTFGSNDVEVIIVNDGSPNGLECDKIVASYKERLNINYLKLEENMGTHVARKIGVENVVGKYFIFVDPDDYLKNETLEIIYEDIQKNGDVDYTYFLFSLLYKHRKSVIVGYVENIESSNVLENMLNGKTYHNLTNRFFNTSFAKKIWSKMVPFYACYHEDYYQMVILHYYAKTKRMIKNPLYVYVQKTGITGVKKCSQEKLKKIILSIYNVDKYLCEFYKQKNCLEYIPLVKNFSITLYVDFMFKAHLKDFINTYQDIVGNASFNNIIAKYISILHKNITKYKKQERLFFPLIMFFSFILRSPKRIKKPSDITKVIDNNTATLKNTATKNDIYEYVSYLEEERSFYEKRAKYYAPIKHILKPFWRFYKHILRRR